MPRPLRDVATTPAPRLSVGISEVDRVLGGGLVPGALVLLGGEPGIGKSTLVLEIAAGVAGAPRPGRGARDGGTDVLYASGEESADQLHLRADRLGLTAGLAGARIQVLAETDLDADPGRSRERIGPALLVVDSVQTLTADGLEGPAGSVGQVRESAARLAAWSHEHGTPVILVGHVTKDGSLAGPRTLEHLVDVVLVLEGDRYGALRLLRGAKNRFGSTEETGRPGDDRRGASGRGGPGARIPRRGRPRRRPGVAVAAILEGTRPILVEVQALVASAGIGMPRRALVGVPADRLALLVAVLGRRCGLDLAQQGPLREPRRGCHRRGAGARPAGRARPRLHGAGRAAARRAPSPAARCRCWATLRPVQGLERRLREAARLGFRQAIVPAGMTASGSGPSHRGPGAYAAPDHRGGDAAGRAGAIDRGRFRYLRGRALTGVASGSLGPMHRFVRLLGGSLGLILAIALTASSAAGSAFDRSVAGYVLLLAWLVAWFVVGYSVLPHITVRARPPHHRERLGPVRGRVRGRRHRADRRARAGPAAGPAAGQLPRSVRLPAAARRLDRAGSRHDGPDRRQARGPPGCGPRRGLLRTPEATRRPGRRRPSWPGRRPTSTPAPSSTAASSTWSRPGFLSGTLVVPRFVLGELQHIADDSDPARRSRGRRGLDVLSVLQKDHRIDLELSDEDVPEVKAVDAKLVALALAHGGRAC